MISYEVTMLRDVTQEDFLAISILLSTDGWRPDMLFDLQHLRDTGNIGAELIDIDNGRVRGHVLFERLRSPERLWQVHYPTMGTRRTDDDHKVPMMRAALSWVSKFRDVTLVALCHGRDNFFPELGFSRDHAAGLSLSIKGAEPMVILAPDRIDVPIGSVTITSVLAQQRY